MLSHQLAHQLTLVHTPEECECSRFPSSDGTDGAAVEALFAAARKLEKAACFATEAVVAKLASLLHVAFEGVAADRTFSDNGVDSQVAIDFQNSWRVR